MYIKKLGFERYRELFNIEAKKYSPNALEFLTKVLPAEKDKLINPLVVLRGFKKIY